MGRRPHRPTGHGFGDGGTNVADYLDLAEQAQERQADERMVRVRVDKIRPSPYQARVEFDLTELRPSPPMLKPRASTSRSRSAE